jgi:S-adenosyl-L-methionine hydrolase (adenosine-forming)
LSVITLLTDFGTQDGYVGIMKGVIWGIAPQVQIADLTHEIAPQDILAGALALARCAPFFPPGTVHIAVVDPGVGTRRRAIAGQLGDQFFVGPDNGLVSLLLETAQAAGQAATLVELDQPAYWLTQVSSSFHGRDIFAPVGAHLANGTPLLKLGSPIHNPLRLAVPQPSPTPHGWTGQVVHIDHFGNLATNLGTTHLAHLPTFHIKIKGIEIHGMVKSFGERQVHELAAMLDSDGRLAIAVVNGSAAQLLQARVGDPVEVDCL